MFYPSTTNALNVRYIEASQLVCKVSYLTGSYVRETCINALNQCCISSLESPRIAFIFVAFEQRQHHLFKKIGF